MAFNDPYPNSTAGDSLPRRFQEVEIALDLSTVSLAILTTRVDALAAATPYAMYRFTSNQPISSAATSTVSWTTASTVFPPQGGFSSIGPGSTVRPPTPGIYHLVWQVSVVNHTTENVFEFLMLIDNGARVIGDYAERFESTNQATRQIDALVPLTSGDTSVITCRVVNLTSTTASLDNTISFLALGKVGNV